VFWSGAQVGCIKEGAYADMIVLDRNPLEDLSVLLDPNVMRIIVKDGIIVKNMIAPV
jgi:imidazolonepropionase-like amidohydrolase